MTEVSAATHTSRVRRAMHLVAVLAVLTACGRDKDRAKILTVNAHVYVLKSNTPLY